MKKLIAVAFLAAVLASPFVLSSLSVADEAKVVDLKDGTKVEIVGDAVNVVAADGSKAPAADGTHEAADGTTITTKDGKIAK